MAAKRAPSTTKAKAPRVLVVGNGAVASGVRGSGANALCARLADPAAIDMVAKADAVVLTGGSDVNPDLYGQRRGKETYGVDDERDMVEMYVLEEAWRRELPVLGICRGAQMMNVFAKGTLHQHLGHVKGARSHWGGQHAVKAAPGSLLERAWDTTDERFVVSLHHQAVDRLGEGFAVAARGPDRIVEAIASTEGPWRLGVQFHPEMMYRPSGYRIFDALALAAAEKAGLPLVPKAWRSSAIERVTPKPTPSNGKAIVKATVRAQQRRKHHFADASLRTSWMCFRCGIRFDERRDHLDHMWMLHGIDMNAGARS